MTEHPELICACRLDGKGGSESLDWSDVDDWTPGLGATWIHLDATHANTDTWLRGQSGLSTFVIEVWVLKRLKWL